MNLTERRFLRSILPPVIGVTIAAFSIVGWESLYDSSRLPREIASLSDDKNFYRLYAACGLYNVATPNNKLQGEQMIQLHGENQTVVAHTNDLDISMGIFPERHQFRGIAERFGYYRYEGVFGNIKIAGGIFCPPRI
jgi:hypothetical protein